MSGSDVRYDCLLELGRGGMGTAFLARSMGTGGFERLVVIKRLHDRLLNEPVSRRRFLDEARLAAHIHHANVVGVQQAGIDDRGPFLVLDYVEGVGLDWLIAKVALERKGIPVPVVLRIALDALAGLHAVHEAHDAEGRPLRVLHRDVSPPNVLVGTDGVARIADFGIAKSAVATSATDPMYLVGKLAYMPPEYLAREPVDERMDIYGMGVTLWQTLSGRRPWPNATEAQLVARIFNSGIPPLATILPVPPQIESVVMRACERIPEDRHRTARAMADEIQTIVRKTGWLASHAEVADTVRALAAAELSQREEVLARAVSASRRALARETTIPPVRSTTAVSSDGIRRTSSHRRPWRILAGTLALGGTTVAIAAVHPAPTENPEAVALSRATAPPGASELVTEPHRPRGGGVAPPHAEPGLPPAHEGEVSAKSPRSPARDTRSLQPRSVPTRNVRTGVNTKGPADITKTNPYR